MFLNIFQSVKIDNLKLRDVGFRLEEKCASIFVYKHIYIIVNCVLSRSYIKSMGENFIK